MGSEATAVGWEVGSEVQAGEQEVLVGADLEVPDSGSAEAQGWAAEGSAVQCSSRRTSRTRRRKPTTFQKTEACRRQGRCSSAG